MFGGSGGGLWAALPVDRRFPGGFPPSLPAQPLFPHHGQGFAHPGLAVWTEQENRVFETALVEFYGVTEEVRCGGIAARIPGKTAEDVREHYRRLERDLRDIESGIVELPQYADAWHESGAGAGPSDGGVKHGSSRGGARAKPEERKKGIPWTEEEHMRFLGGLEKYGKGDWRSISRHSVVTRTATQVASHAQKYFLRRKQGKKDRRRGSIHDVTMPCRI